ncbi:hypothetical protein IEQ34_021519 [Dendrobium chrysotoxum]|uniref:Ubiquitin-like domain-containing protein n=1 Tax=Dendrobium chrysotoxum TaxID=161865 RepID=A0AAV7G5S6_DENCH|nr:hypothetical protein IEQ34_021519 [Dendrobium chrysotoxum]
MGTSGAAKMPMVNGDVTEESETTVEIKIKTLDSQTYPSHFADDFLEKSSDGSTTYYFKQVPVPALKEQIATVTGVLSEQQRLICRGKVLKDDQLLSAYRILALKILIVL